MPTRTDITVVNQAYDTSGNGGRKLVRLSNGFLVAVQKSGNFVYVEKSTDNGATWSSPISINEGTTVNDVAIANKGDSVYGIVSYGTQYVEMFRYNASTHSFVGGFPKIDQSQTALGNVSLAINSAGTELHAAWASKNSTYPNSWNIRYAKGTIDADGSVTWGAVQQISSVNSSGYDIKNPCIIVYNSNPIIFAEYKTTEYGIACYRWNGTGWLANSNVYSSTSYVQSSPSAIFVPSEINGLPNGRIWVAWHGRDSTDTSVNNIRVSYSDDGGETWAAMEKLTSGNKNNKVNASITANHNNEVFILYWDFNSVDVYKIKHNGTAWETPMILHDTSRSFNNPSALFDNTFSLDFSEPLFIFQENTVKVGFYGTWTVTTISVPQGYIGQKTSADKSNILSYSITTDGTMSDITEKINGVTIATRTNPTSGQQFTVSLSQAQWDAIKFGNGHTLTIEMNGETWTYTFDKRLNANDDILSAVKGVQDLQTHLNAIKSQLASAIRAKGGTVNDTDAWSAFVSAVNNMSVKKFAQGTVTSSSTTSTFEYATTTSTVSLYTVTVNGLTFKPILIYIYGAGDSTYDRMTVYSDNNIESYPKTVKAEDIRPDGANTTVRYYLKADVRGASVTSTSFTLPVTVGNEVYTWIAIG